MQNKHHKKIEKHLNKMSEHHGLALEALKKATKVDQELKEHKKEDKRMYKRKVVKKSK